MKKTLFPPASSRVLEKIASPAQEFGDGKGAKNAYARYRYRREPAAAARAESGRCAETGRDKTLYERGPLSETTHAQRYQFPPE